MMEDHRVAREARSEAREIAYAARDERREARWDAMMNHMIRIHASLVGVTQSASSPLVTSFIPKI